MGKCEKSIEHHIAGEKQIKEILKSRVTGFLLHYVFIFICI